MADHLPLILQLLCGAIGANLAGAIMKTLSLGTMWNSIVGIIGGGIGAYVLGLLGLVEADTALAASNLNLGNIVSSVSGGAIGGGLLLSLIGLIRNARHK